MGDYIREHATYLSLPINDFDSILRRAERDQRIAQADTLVGTGISGAVVVHTLAMMLGKHWAIIRKRGEKTHAHGIIEGKIGHKWVFVDDLIDTGKTFDRVHREMDLFSEKNEWPTVYVGCFMYHR